MEVKKFIKLTHRNKKQPIDVIERKLLLYAATKETSKYSTREKEKYYYKLYLEDCETKERFFIFNGSADITDVLNQIDFITKSHRTEPFTIMLEYQTRDGSKENFYDLVLYDLDDIVTLITNEIEKNDKK